MSRALKEDSLAARARAIAQAFHETYERRAPAYGYKTRDESAVPWDELHPTNKSLMVSTVHELLERGVIPGDEPAADQLQKVEGELRSRVREWVELNEKQIPPDASDELAEWVRGFNFCREGIFALIDPEPEKSRPQKWCPTCNSSPDLPWFSSSRNKVASDYAVLADPDDDDWVRCLDPFHAPVSPVAAETCPSCGSNDPEECRHGDQAHHVVQGLHCTDPWHVAAESRCGWAAGPKDPVGCVLPEGHEGKHRFNPVAAEKEPRAGARAGYNHDPDNSPPIPIEDSPVAAESEGEK